MNPFYVMLLLAGIAFAITACAYGVMTVRQLNASRIAGYGVGDQSSPADFNALVDQYGPKAMIIEIIVLGIGTAGAIAYDQRLDRLMGLTGEAATES